MGKRRKTMKAHKRIYVNYSEACGAKEMFNVDEGRPHRIQRHVIRNIDGVVIKYHYTIHHVRISK